jgi:hypothetical protein
MGPAVFVGLKVKANEKSSVFLLSGFAELGDVRATLSKLTNETMLLRTTTSFR